MRSDPRSFNAAAATRATLRAAIASVPPGRWGVAVSGGADSVATLRLLARRARANPELSLTVLHVDHQLRGAEAVADAKFVQALAQDLGLVSYIMTRAEVEGRHPRLRARAGEMASGLAARMRQVRLAMFREAARRHQLSGVILGHHSDDVAETLMIRLLRGSPRSGTLGLALLRRSQVVGGVLLLRPMLQVRRRRLRRFLERTGCSWREDASNASASQLRNRVRMLLTERPRIAAALLELAWCAAAAETQLEAVTPELEASPRLQNVVVLPEPIRRRALRRWLVAQGVPQGSTGPRTVDLLQEMLDVAGPATMDLPGGVRVYRRGGRLGTGGRGAEEGQFGGSGG